jgi:hypothetical protein
MGDLYVMHGLFTTAKPEFSRRLVYNVCILVRKKWIPGKLVSFCFDLFKLF